MNTRIVSTVMACSLLLTLGWGCTRNTDGQSTDDSAASGTVKGATDNAPDGKGAAPFELCISTEGDVSGEVKLSAANGSAPRKNFSQWFTASPVAISDAGKEICGAMNFAVESGDKVYVNGSWKAATRFLVDNRGHNGAAHDDIKEIWIDDQYYEVGKDCVYQSNNVKGYDLVCNVR